MAAGVGLFVFVITPIMFTHYNVAPMLFSCCWFYFFFFCSFRHYLPNTFCGAFFPVQFPYVTALGQGDSVDVGCVDVDRFFLCQLSVVVCLSPALFLSLLPLLSKVCGLFFLHHAFTHREQVSNPVELILCSQFLPDVSNAPSITYFAYKYTLTHERQITNPSTFCRQWWWFTRSIG